MSNKVVGCGNAGKITTIAEWFEQVDPKFSQLAKDLHHLVMQTVPQFGQAIKWGHPSYTVDGKVRCYIAEQFKCLHLGFFNGASIANEDGIIEGTGKRLRHIKLTKLTPELEKRLAVAITESYNLPPDASHP